MGSAADETSQTNAGTEHTGEEAQNAKKGGKTLVYVQASLTLISLGHIRSVRMLIQ